MVFRRNGLAAWVIFCRLSAYYALAAGPGLEEAIALIRSGRLKEAEAALDRNLGEPRALYWKGYVQFASQRYKESVLTLTPYIAQAPEDAQARKVLGLDLFMLGDGSAAQVQLERAVELDAKDPEARYYLGRVYFSRQNMPAALAAFQKVVETDATSVRGYNHLGQTFEALNQFERAQKAYETAIALDRTQQRRSEWPYYNLGLLQLNAGRSADAVSHFEEALRVQPKFAEARLKRAVALASLGRREEALAELQSLVKDEPASADAHYQLGRLYTRLGNTEKGKEHLLQFQRLRRP